MNLNSTEKLIDKMIKEKDFDSYAVLVSKDGRKGYLCPMIFKPGTCQQYSCNGMILLGYIIKKTIRFKALEEVFNEKNKKPLGYTRSKSIRQFGRGSGARLAYS